MISLENQILPTSKLWKYLDKYFHSPDKRILDQWITMHFKKFVIPQDETYNPEQTMIELHETSPRKGKMTPRQCAESFKQCVKSLRNSTEVVRCAFVHLVWTDNPRYADTMEGENENVHANDFLIYCHARNGFVELNDPEYQKYFLHAFHIRFGNRFWFNNMVVGIDFPNDLDNGGALSLESILVKVAGVSRDKAAVIVKVMNEGSPKMENSSDEKKIDVSEVAAPKDNRKNLAEEKIDAKNVE